MRHLLVRFPEANSESNIHVLRIFTELTAVDETSTWYRQQMRAKIKDALVDRN